MIGRKSWSLCDRTLFRAAFAAVVVVLALLAPAPAAGAEDPIPGRGGLPDIDNRTGSVTPSAEQLAIVADLGAEARWNNFGTPQSLIKYGGYLAEGISGDAVTVARSWLAANKTLFRLSDQGLAQLELVNDAVLTGSEGHAVIFRQTFDGLPAAHDGILTVGVVGDKVVYASSLVTGDTNLSGAVVLSEKEAWLKAATDVGRTVALADILSTKTDRDWTIYNVAGFAQAQRVRLVAVPTPLAGVRPAYETVVLDVQGGRAEAYMHLIDAETGDVILRRNMVEQSHQIANVFDGTIGPADGTCDTDRGPWVVTEGENVRSIDVSVEALLTTNDSVIHLKRDGEVVAAQDTLFSPEAIHYAPPSGVPAGEYTVQVCDYVDGAPWSAPTTYSGQIVFNPIAGTSIPYPPKWNVFEAFPASGDLSSDDLRKLWCWDAVVQGEPVPGCTYEVSNVASRSPWDFNVQSNTPTFTTVGNNAVSAEAWTSPLTPGATHYRPFSASREYNYPWTNAWGESDCFAPFVPGESHDISAAVTNLFVMHNRMHDWSYFLGFTEENWNAQLNNFGNGGMEDDPVIGNAQAGALDSGYPVYLGRDNANMITLLDGISPITNMYLWQPLKGAFYAPCVDGDFDMSVIGHEYSHLIENRMIGKGGLSSGHHVGSMGESHADLLAVEYLNEYGFAGVGDENPYTVGAYVTSNGERGIRNYAMSDSPLNFSDMGYDITGAQVHADGEIWSAVNFDLRQAFIEKYDATHPVADEAMQQACADGERHADDCPGNRRWVQLMIDAMLLMPPAPTMLDARDAQLAADLMRFGGANQATLWQVFARRGFGAGAFVSGSSDTNPVADFASPVEENATVTFEALASDEGRAAIESAQIYVGRYEARVSPIADTDPATNATTPDANNVDDVAEFAPGTYEFIAHAPGYGHVRFTETFKAGQNRVVRIEFPSNWASMALGATANGDGARFDDLIDDTEATNWELDGTPVVNSQVTVDLAGTEPVQIRRVNVSGMLLPGQNRFTAIRQFELLTCVASAANNHCADASAFTSVYVSPEDAFPSGAPRPAAPDMILRSFELPQAAEATHVRLVVLDNQCTGNTAFHGEQDADPLNATDCRTNADDPPESLPARDTAVRIAEFQVFSR